ncbi:hypothetical protein PHMEG_00011453 [Phytophthora megakarya]|uniref:DDE Tnp4 domain-containing protein n=1 Tax=Phytophthora megakarya TaxID=4795 RepID=A0A225WCM1_9STRA|nr:hypothetical protein PHMEG_00011453 [Phytophthora megakarya]
MLSVQHSIRNRFLSGNTSKTFNTRAFERALRTPGTGWFHDKLRCNKKSFLRIYRLVHAVWGREPGPNTKNPVIKRVALTMLYLVKGGTMDQAARALGISRPRSVVYINETLNVLSALAKSMISMSTAEELVAVEDGFYATTGFPDTIGAVDGTLVRIACPHDLEGWYCRKNFPAVNMQAIVDHRGLFRSISLRSGSNNDQSPWNGSGVKKRISSYVPPGKHLLADAGYKIWGHMLTPFLEADAIRDPSSRRLTSPSEKRSRSSSPTILFVHLTRAAAAAGSGASTTGEGKLLGCGNSKMVGVVVGAAGSVPEVGKGALQCAVRRRD